MQVLAQSTSTQSDARPPYIHLGYLSASPSHFMELGSMAVVCLAAYCLLLVKLDVAGLFLWFCRGFWKSCTYRPIDFVAIVVAATLAAMFVWWA